MKNRKVIFVLLPLVVVVWGVIIYRVVVVMNGGNPPVGDAISMTQEPKTETINYQLALNYADPFLGTRQLPKPAPKVQVTKHRPRKQKKSVSKKVSIPALRYNGRVENRTSNEERHMISVNGKAHIITIGNEIDGVVLKRVFSDSVEFKWNKETIYVKR